MKKGFTLIELLVVISIIGILATLLLANFNTARGRARDAQRKSDMKNLQTALRLYYNDNERYPLGTDASNWYIRGCMPTGSSDCVWGSAIFGNSNQTYMAIMPDDPEEGDGRNYRYVAVGTDDFYLLTCLENKSDDNCYEGGDPYIDGAAGHRTWCENTNDGCLYIKKP